MPNTLSMEFNWLTFNGKAGLACTPMLVKQGERVRIRPKAKEAYDLYLSNFRQMAAAYPQALIAQRTFFQA